MSTPHDILPLVSACFRGVLQASWQGALAIVLVLLARRALGARVPARWHYLLWFLVLARLLVPAVVLPRSPASLENIRVFARPFERWPEPGARPAVSEGPGVDLPAPRQPATLPRATVSAALPLPVAAHHSWSWELVAALVWLAGAAGFGVWLLGCALGLKRKVRRETVAVEAETLRLWQACCQRWLRRTPPPLVAADWVDSPALVGWLRPVLLIPRREIDAFTAQDWEHVFAHEIAHLRWRDHWSQVLLLAAWCVHWFNPVVWVGLRRLCADRELAADEWVLRHLEGERALAYGETLFKTLAQRPARLAFQPGMVGISEDGAQMKQRLVRITAFLPQRRRLYGSLAGCAALLCLGSLVLGQGTLDPAKKPAATPATPTPGPAPVRTEQDVRDDLLAAARTGNPKKVSALFNSKDEKLLPRYRRLAPTMLDGLLRGGDMPAFAALYDALQLLPSDYQGHWKPSDDLLLALVKDGRTDALDALMARGLDLKCLAEPAKGADPATAAWIERRVTEVGKQRADILALEKAAGDGDLDTIRRLLDAGVDVNVVGPDHNTPLIRAVFKNRLEAAQLLLDRGALVDKPRFPGWDYTPLCLVNSVPMAELLKKNGANVHAKLYSRDVSILTYVAQCASSEVVEWFLQQGLDPKMAGDDHNNLLFGLKDGRTARLLLDRGLDPNQLDDSGHPPLCDADSRAVAQALIDHGARVTGFKQPLVPSMISYGFGCADAVAAVLKAGADHDPATLQEAISLADEENVKYRPDKEKLRQVLLSYGAQPTPASQGIQPGHHYDVRVSAADGTLLGGDSTQVHVEQTFAQGGRMGGNIPVGGGGTAPVWINDDAPSAVLSAKSDGFATAYAGPFTPPAKEKLDAVSFRLERGFRAVIVTVDDAGRPIAGTRLTAYYPGPPQEDLGAAVTDAAGQAAFDHIGTAPLTVRASADGYASDTVDAIRLDPAKPYRWTLRRASALPGVVTAVATGQSVAAAKIKLAGVRGPHDETHADPADAPLLAVADARGRFALTSLRPDSVYDLYVEAPGYGGVLLNGIKTARAGLLAALGPELTVRGKVIHIPAGRLYEGGITMAYNQFFKIGDGLHAVGKSWTVKVVNGEAEFVTAPLYDNAVSIQTERDGVELQAKDLPKSGVVIDLAKPAVTPTPAPATPTPTPPPPVAKARVVNAQGQPVAGASIQPYTEIRGDTWQFPATRHNKTHTEQDGRFSYSVPGYTKVGVMVVARGYARKLAVVPYDNPSPDIVLGPGVEVTGKLLKDGKPLFDIEVGIAQVDRSSSQFLEEIVAKTDQDGRFTLPDVAPNNAYEVHAKRDSLRALGAVAPKRVSVGEAGSTVSVGDLVVEPGVVVTGRVMLPDGSLPTADEYTTEPDGRRLRNAAANGIQLHVYRENAFDYQYINLQPDLHFSLPALPGEKLSFSAWVPGYKLRGDKYGVMEVRVAADMKPVDMVYDPESPEAKERAQHPVFTPPSTPIPTPAPTTQQVEVDAKAAQDWAAKLAAQPHHAEVEWREQFGKIRVGMTRDEVYALLPPKTVSIDYLQRDEYDEETVHTSFYALDGEFAVALTFDFKGDQAWNAAGQPSPRPKADENHLIKPPVLMRHDKTPNKDNEVQLEKARKA